MATTTLDKREVSVKKMLFTAEDYQEMGVKGIFRGKPKVELIDGEILTISPISADHNGHVDKISRFLNRKLFETAIIRTQGSIRLDDYSEPQPDLAILKFDPGFYSDRMATAQDVLLIVEVAILSEEFDRTEKLQKYASVGIPEYWVVLPQKGIVEVNQNPSEDDYANKSTYDIESQWVLKAFDLSINGKDLLIH